MKKAELKHGNVVELRNKSVYLYNLTGFSLLSFNGEEVIDTRLYRKDLTFSNPTYPELDIVKVYKDFTLKEVLWERKELIKLSDDEKAILRSEKKQFKCEYIARNEDGKLFTFKTKPKKEEDRGIWVIDNNRYFYRLTSIEHLLFQFIKWEDNEPYKIEDLLKEVLENDK